MISGGTIFDAFKWQSVKSAHWIIKVTDGTDTWLLSKDLEIELTDGHVYPLLTRDPVIKEKVDLYTKRWSVSDMSITISNIPYLKHATSAVPTRLSDEFATPLVGQVVEAYYMLGTNFASVRSLSDMMLRYSGEILVHPSYTEKAITLKAVDKGRTSHRDLPQNIMGTAGWFAEHYDNAETHIPLIYGKFTHDVDARDGTGLAEGVPYNNGRVIICNRACNALTESWFKMNAFPNLCEYTAETLQAAYSTHYGHVDPSGNNQAFAHVNPIGLSSGGTYNRFAFTTILTPNIDNILNNNLTDYVDIYENYKDATQSNAYVLFIFPDYAGGDGNTNDNGIGIMNGSASYMDVIAEHINLTPAAMYANVYYAKSHQIVIPPYANYDNMIPGLRVASAQFTSSATVLDSVAFNCQTDLSSYGEASGTTWADNIGWHLEQGHDASEVGPGENRVCMVLQTYRPGLFGGTINTVYAMRVYFVKMRLAFKPYLQNIQGTYAACEGPDYGSWITGRSSNYSAGDTIETPAGIIEDILREELGYADADIDLPSFINAEDTSLVHKIQIREDNKLRSNDFIKKICEQTPYAFYVSGAGKARMIDLSDTSPTTAVTIPWSHIKKDSLVVGRHKWIINQIDHESRYHREQDQYQDIGSIVHTQSQTDYDERVYKAKWEYIVDAAGVQILERHLVHASYQGLWANPKPIISVKVDEGYANLEVGDWFELDATTVDPNMLCHGSSWASKQFIIDSVSVASTGVTLTAIELNE